MSREDRRGLLEVRATTEVEADLLLVAGFEGEAPPVGGLPGEPAEAVGRLAERTGWNGRRGQLVETLGDGAVGRVALRGLGRRETLFDLKRDAAIRAMVRAASTSGARRLALALPADLLDEPGAGDRLGRQIALALYRFDRFKSGSDDEDRSALDLERVDLVAGDRPGFAAAVARATRVAASVAFTRDLGNTPPNVATPEWMAGKACELISLGVEVEVLEPDELAERGMGGVLAVGGGSANPPRLVHLRWRPAGVPAGRPRVALVGKGVTFDTGGISIKPSAKMEEMKYDKCGACTVLGALHAVASLGLPIAVDGYTPFAENMPDGRAYRPSDIVTCYGGTTVEIHNTDAEGRMILADALALAAEGKPDALVELSTLTGASVVALGQTGAALYTPSDELAAALLDAAGLAGERLWRMPLWPEFREAMKGEHGDLKNTGGRWGGANTAAAFLSSFVGDTERWAHLDIAGPAYRAEGDEADQGGTGYGVAFLVGWLESLAG